MKIIHCADLHLNSRMTANLTEDKARERKAELLHTFIRMVDYAREQGVSAILIAGDLFDGNQISRTTRNTVYEQIKIHPDLDFYYLQGNHDSESFLADMSEVPENLKLFDSSWKTYLLNPKARKKVAVTGVELGKENNARVYDSLVLDTDCFNIVVMHGQESQQQGKDKTEVIALRELRNKGIDYLALGHIHKYKEEKLDNRGIYCYSGALEGRGFDECGEHGFVLLTIDEEDGSFRHTFVPHAERILYEIPIDISGCLTSVEIMGQIEHVLKQDPVPAKSLVKLVLTGEVDIDCEKSVDLLQKRFQDEFYFLKIYDESKWKVDYQSYALDASLKGEFVRAVQGAKELSEEEKLAVIRYGVQALTGEKIGKNL